MLRKHIDRRTFIKNTALLSTGVLSLPPFINNLSLNNISDNKLIVLQLSGGNDGLNTFIPYRNDTYFQLRPTLSYKQNDIIKINDDIGLNPSFEPIRGHYDNGDIAIINNVGYPNPTRSHFKSMDIWHTASLEKSYNPTGWLGMYLDSCNNCNSTDVLELDSMLSLALKGKSKNGISFTNPEEYYNITKSLKNYSPRIGSSNDNLNFLNEVNKNIAQSANYLYNYSTKFKSKLEYPKNQFGQRLKLTGELINSGIESKVFYISLNGFDTHANQKQKHQKLLSIYAQSVDSLIQDLKKSNNWENTLILTFSEFGRRVSENNSKGTDHGTANNIILASGGLKNNGILNEIANLNDLENGDLKFTVDFREIYSTILDKWLSANSNRILGEQFPHLNFI